MVELYLKKIRNQEVNAATGNAWTIEDVPVRWRDAVREVLDNA